MIELIRLEDNLEKEMASFYTEGLVEREARKFSEKYGSAVPFEKANYGYNINFVNRIKIVYKQLIIVPFLAKVTI